MYLKEIEWEGVEWMHLVQDRNQWWAVVYTVQTFRFHKSREFLD
jgi:hypothetical protein